MGPRTLAYTGGPVYAFAQDGGRIAWASFDDGSACPWKIRVRTLATRVQTAITTAAHFRGRMTALGFDLRPGDHPMVPVMAGDAVEAGRLAAGLVARGVYAVAFSYPVVPHGAARIRTQMSAAHTIADLDFAVEQFAAAREAVRE